MVWFGLGMGGKVAKHMTTSVHDFSVGGSGRTSWGDRRHLLFGKPRRIFDKILAVGVGVAGPIFCGQKSHLLVIRAKAAGIYVSRT